MADRAVVVSQTVLLCIDAIASLAAYYRDDHCQALVVGMCINCGYAFVPLTGVNWNLFTPDYWWAFRVENALGLIATALPFVLGAKALHDVNVQLVRRALGSARAPPNAAPAAGAGPPMAPGVMGRCGPRAACRALYAVFAALCAVAAALLAVVLVQLYGTDCQVPPEWATWAQCEWWSYPLFQRPACSCRLMVVYVRPDAQGRCPKTAALLHHYPRMEFYALLHDSFRNAAGAGVVRAAELNNTCKEVTARDLRGFSGHPHLMYLLAEWTGPLRDSLAVSDLPRLLQLDLTGSGLTSLPADRGVWAGFPELRTLIVFLNHHLAALPAGLAAAPKLETITALSVRACIDRDAVPVALQPMLDCGLPITEGMFAGSPGGVCTADMAKMPGFLVGLGMCEKVTAPSSPWPSLRVRTPCVTLNPLCLTSRLQAQGFRHPVGSGRPWLYVWREYTCASLGGGRRRGRPSRCCTLCVWVGGRWVSCWCAVP